jgi:hypothetical protein
VIKIYIDIMPTSRLHSSFDEGEHDIRELRRLIATLRVNMTTLFSSWQTAKSENASSRELDFYENLIMEDRKEINVLQKQIALLLQHSLMGVSHNPATPNKMTGDNASCR